jgi:hypothetical protein
MKRIIRWLETRLSSQNSPNPSNASSDSDSAKLNRIDLGINLPKELQDMVNDMPTPKFELPKEIQEPSKNDVMPDIYSDEHDVTVPHLKVVDQPALEDGESAGFDPCDTAKVQKE